MAKVQLKKDKSSVSVTNTTKGTKKQKKKKRFWPNKPSKATKGSDKKKGNDEKKTSLLLPPKTPQEFSVNWKALEVLLKPEKSSSVNEATPEKLQKKDPKLSDKKDVHPVKVKTSPKVNGQLKGSPSVAKEDKKSPKEHPSSSGDVKQDVKKKKKRKLKPEEEIKNTMRKKQKLHEKNKTEEANKVESTKYDIWFDDVDPNDIEAALGPEAGDIARKMQGLPEKTRDPVDVVLVKERAFEGLTRTVAMDCEMVGVGPEGEESILARVSIVNQFGKCVYDKYVKPTELVTDYRTAVSGIRPKDIKNGEDFKVVQQEVSELLQGRILVGHAVHNDLKILFLDHPKKAIRDTQKYKPFKKRVQSGRPSLKLLCEKILSVKVQTKEHCSIQDAQAAMRLYTLEKKHWEAEIKAKHSRAKPEAQKHQEAPAK
ncbi:RNA exonuclease 4 [Pelobates cultripes]|uniref:RNA exonuclease 4 n=1 Tax=Pelobates cultripes TaxID=61616 RepID=A0AAD1WPG4_PELCU|nr:RNA exonuclease 4 [Pelobates cultripes]